MAVREAGPFAVSRQLVFLSVQISLWAGARSPRQQQRYGFYGPVADYRTPLPPTTGGVKGRSDSYRVKQGLALAMCRDRGTEKCSVSERARSRGVVDLRPLIVTSSLACSCIMRAASPRIPAHRPNVISRRRDGRCTLSQSKSSTCFARRTRASRTRAAGGAKA